MGKSIRSKRKKRLRTLRREIVESHYEAKDAAKLAVLEAALAAPKISLPLRAPPPDIMEVEHVAAEQRDALTLVVPGSPAGTSKLKVRGGIKKRGPSKGRLKKLRHRKKKLNF